jgi:murein DD-endopeptidase MepM/ murein hydrolase activator NlpD
MGMQTQTSKLVGLALLLLAASCAPKSNALRGFVGEMRSPEFYQDFDNWENEDDTAFEAQPEQHNHGLETPEQESAPTTPSQPEAAGPATPSDLPSDLPNADANYPHPNHQKRTPVTRTQEQPRVETQTPVQPEPREREQQKQRDSKSKRDTTQPNQKSGTENCMTSDSPCFPIAGKNHFTDNFGAARSGGRRHAGIDIFALKLVPIVAVEDGVIDVVKVETRGLSGNYIGINHGNGVRTLYMHLNNDSPNTNDGRGHGIVAGIKVGLHVKKGQHIGWVGNSGNAETTPAHLHFEMRVSDNRNAIRMREFYPTNPFKFLMSTEPKKRVLAFALNY